MKIKKTFKNMSLIKCPTCKAEISYNYDICPNCGNTIYDFESDAGTEDQYDSDYKDYVFTTRKTRWYHATILLLSALAMVLGIMWGAEDVMASKQLNAAPQESYILFVGGLGLFIFTKIMIRSDKRHQEF